MGNQQNLALGLGGVVQGEDKSSSSLAPTLSIEYFPPREEEAWVGFRRAVVSLECLTPSLVTVTWGAGGSTQEPSLAALGWLQQRYRGFLPKVTAHITAAGQTKAQILALAAQLWQGGVRHLVALRGDAAEVGAKFQPHPEGFSSTAEMVAALKSVAPFWVAVGCYPETHPDAADSQADLSNLKAKFDSGADYAFSQFFFDADVYLRFRDAASKHGIDPLTLAPGILPIHNFSQVKRFANRCGAGIPSSLASQYEAVAHDPEAHQNLARQHCVSLISTLRREGVQHFHLYSLNRSQLLLEIVKQSGIYPRDIAKAA